MVLLTLQRRDGTRLTIENAAGDTALRVRFPTGRRTVLLWRRAPIDQVVALLSDLRADYRPPDWIEGAE